MIDWSRSTELQEEVGADDFGEVLEIFLEEVEEALASYSDDKPLQTRGEAMHFLKGSALNLGFAALAEVCQAGESAAKDGSDTLPPIAEVRQIYDASKSVFLSGAAENGLSV